MSSTHLDPDVVALTTELTETRRVIHRHPELGFQEVRTAALVSERLRSLGLTVKEGVARTGVVGLLQGGRPGKTILLRADMDALPIQEASGAEYASKIPGVMHACGHDAHTAMLLGAARVLMARRDRLAGNVKFVFQPAEEGPGGARPMIEAGVMQNPQVDLAFGLHLINDFPVGVVALRPGPVMASMDTLEITVKGKGGHGAFPHQAVDSIVIAAQVVMALQTLASREINPTVPVVLTLGTIHGGFRHNVIAPEVSLTGTVRTFDESLRKTFPERIERVVRQVCQAFRAEAEVRYEFGYPVTVNDPAMTHFVQKIASEVVGPERVWPMDAMMGSEDMAYFLRVVPGCFFFLGSSNPAKNLTVPHHSPEFDFDEACLPLGVQVLVRLVERALEDH